MVVVVLLLLLAIVFGCSLKGMSSWCCWVEECASPRRGQRSSHARGKRFVWCLSCVFHHYLKKRSRRHRRNTYSLGDTPQGPSPVAWVVCLERCPRSISGGDRKKNEMHLRGMHHTHANGKCVRNQNKHPDSSFNPRFCTILLQRTTSVCCGTTSLFVETDARGAFFFMR